LSHCHFQITVQYIATIDTADFSDFSPIAGVVNIFDGQTESTVPLNIINDNIPEFSERFTIELNSVSGGANLGATQTASVTILPNDDPNGALGTYCYLDYSCMYPNMYGFLQSLILIVE